MQKAECVIFYACMLHCQSLRVLTGAGRKEKAEVTTGRRWKISRYGDGQKKFRGG